MARILVPSLAVIILTVSFITKCSAYEDYEDQIRNYYDTVYQRSSQVSGESNDVDLKMPGVHPVKVSS